MPESGATQFKNVVKTVKTGHRLGFEYFNSLAKIRDALGGDDLPNLAPGGTPQLIDDVLLREAEANMKAYREWLNKNFKTDNKSPLVKYLKGKSSIESESQKTLLQQFLSGKAELNKEALRKVGIHGSTGAAANVLALIGDGYAFPDFVNPSSDVTAENMQGLITNKQWSAFFKARAADKDGKLITKFKSVVQEIEASPTTLTTNQEPEKTSPQSPEATKATSDPTPETEKTLRGKRKQQQPIELSREEALKRDAAKALESDADALALAEPLADAAIEDSLAKLAKISEGSSSKDPPVSAGEQRLAEQGLLDNADAAKAAELAAAKELQIQKNAAKEFASKRQSINKQTGKGSLENLGGSLPQAAIESSLAKLAANEQASQAERNEAAKIIQSLASKRARLRAATAFREQMVEDRRAEPFRGFQPGNLNPSTAIPQREAVTPDAEPVLDESNVAKRIEGTGDVGTDSAPVENLVMENVSRGHEGDDVSNVSKIMKGVGSTDKDDEKEVSGLNIGEAKDRIRALHKVFDSLIPEFKSAAHKKSRDEALKSSDEKAVKKHLLKMFKKIRAFYSGGPSGLRVGIVIPAEAIIQSLLGSSSAAPAPVSAPSQTTFGLGGSQRAAEHPGSVIHKKGSDPYGTAMSIAIHRRNSGMSSFLRKGVANHEVTNTVPIITGKVHKPIIKMNQNTPMPGNIGQIMGRTTKSLGIKIKM